LLEYSVEIILILSISRNKRKLEQAREKLKDTDLAKDKEKEEKTKKELQGLEKKASINFFFHFLDSIYMYHASQRTPACYLTFSPKHSCEWLLCTYPAVCYGYMYIYLSKCRTVQNS